MDQSVNFYRIQEAISFLSENFRQQPDLSELAKKVHVSSFHFQRMFLDWVGITPKKFLQYLTITHLKSNLQQTKNLIDAAESSGLSSQSRVYELFVNIEGVTPQQYKSGGKGIEIFYGYHSSPFGMCFIAVSEKGICDLHFIDEDQTRNEYLLFQQKWPFATLIHQPDFTQNFIKKIFGRTSDDNSKLNLLVQGTDFQIKVWEALVKIPFAGVTSYQDVAKSIGHHSSIRSVASAAGKNPILYLIPCHRIIKTDGTVGNFQYGKVRKRTMIAWEMATKAVK